MAHVTAVDYSQLSVEKAKDYNKAMIAAGRCEVLQGDVSDLQLPASLKFEKIIDGMKNYTAEAIEAALKAAGFSEVASDHHASKPWITVLAKKG